MAVVHRLRRDEAPNTSSSLSSISVETVLLCLVVVCLSAIFISCVLVPLYRRRVARRPVQGFAKTNDDKEEDDEAHLSLLNPTEDSLHDERVPFRLSFKRHAAKILGKRLSRRPSRPVVVMRVPTPEDVNTYSSDETHEHSTDHSRSRLSTPSRRGLSTPSPHSPPSTPLPPIPTSPQSPTVSLDAAVRLVTTGTPTVPFSHYSRPSFDNTRGILAKLQLPVLPPLDTLLEMPMEEKESRPVTDHPIRKRTDESTQALSSVSIPSNLELAANANERGDQSLDRATSTRSSISSGIFPPSPVIGFRPTSLAKLITTDINRHTSSNSGSPSSPRSAGGSRPNSSVPMKRKQSSLTQSTSPSQQKASVPSDADMFPGNNNNKALNAGTSGAPVSPHTHTSTPPSSEKSNPSSQSAQPLTTAFRPHPSQRSGTPSSTATTQIHRWPSVNTVVWSSSNSLPSSSTSERDTQPNLDVPQTLKPTRARSALEGKTHTPLDIPPALRTARARTFQAKPSPTPMPNISEVDTPSSGEPLTTQRSTRASTASSILQSMSVSGLDSLQAITHDDQEEAVVLKAVAASLQPVRSLPVPPNQSQAPSWNPRDMEPGTQRSEGSAGQQNVHHPTTIVSQPNTSRAFSPRPLPTPPTTTVRPAAPSQPDTTLTSSTSVPHIPLPPSFSGYPPPSHTQSTSTDTLGKPRLHSRTRSSSGYTVREAESSLALARAASIDKAPSERYSEADIQPSSPGVTADPSRMTPSSKRSSADTATKSTSPTSPWMKRQGWTDPNGRRVEVIAPGHRKGAHSQDVVNTSTFDDAGTFGGRSRLSASAISHSSVLERSASDRTHERPTQDARPSSFLQPPPLSRSHSTSSNSSARFVKRRQSPALQPLPAALILSSRATPTHSRSASLTGSFVGPEEQTAEVRPPPFSAPVPPSTSLSPSFPARSESRRSSRASSVRYSVSGGNGSVVSPPGTLPPLEFGNSWNTEDLLGKLP